MMFDNIYSGKKILITGHTGFKGSWLTAWLLKLGAEIIGVSKDIPTHPSLFTELRLSKSIKDHRVDICEFDKISDIIESEKPDFLFHLAAQPIVSTSYKLPVETISSNVMGTSNILESLRCSNHPCVAIIITSDKAYDNVEQVWGYKEDDKMGGKDIYSGSKGAAELIIKSFYHSFFKLDTSNIKLAIGRAGNVIGGGDWAQDRIVVDCMESWSRNVAVDIRNPNATRPWQHVLEPLSGYLKLGLDLSNNDSLNGSAFNFGPNSDQNRTVKNLLKDLYKFWNFSNESQAYNIKDNSEFHEAGLLKLNCDKALYYLDWKANLDYEHTIKYTSKWYFNFYKKNLDIYEYTKQQISDYEKIAKNKNFSWTE